MLKVENNLPVSLTEIYRDAALHVHDKLSRGVIYRGPCPVLYQNLDEKDFDSFYRRNQISLKIDLRAKKEIEKQPIKAAAIPVKLLPIDPWKYFPSDVSDWESAGIIMKTYGYIIIDELEVLKNSVETILLNLEATLIHCTSGRDRTGIIIAMGQLLAGTPVDGVLKVLWRLLVLNAQRYWKNAFTSWLPEMVSISMLKRQIFIRIRKGKSGKGFINEFFIR